VPHSFFSPRTARQLCPPRFVSHRDHDDTRAYSHSSQNGR
jgi:hypothetical protein